MTSVVFVYPNSRRDLITEWKAGRAPETLLLGLNQLATHGFDVRVHEPALDSRLRLLPARVRWHLRELPLAWELGDADVAFTPLANVVPLAARMRRKPRVVVFNYGLNTILRRGSAARRRALRASLRRAAAVVCLGRSQRDELVDLGGPSHAPVVLFGIDHRFFAPPDDTERERLVLSVGKDLARDYETLASAAREVEARFVLVTLARNLTGVTLPSNVEVQENIPYTQLRDLYARASCAVVTLHRPEFPYGSEASGITALLEAQAMATPVVATDRPIVREYVSPEATLVPARDPVALRDAIRHALDDGGAGGRLLVEERHTMETMAAQLAPVLRAAAVRGRDGPPPSTS